jgi:hypothetical protein
MPKWERANVHVKNVFVAESVFERHGLLLEIERPLKLFAGTVVNVAFWRVEEGCKSVSALDWPPQHLGTYG